MLLNVYLNTTWGVTEIMQKRAKLKPSSFHPGFSVNSKDISIKLNEMPLIYQEMQ